MFLAVPVDQYCMRVQGVCRMQPVILLCMLHYISCTNDVLGWTESAPENVLRPNRNDVGLEWFSTRTCTCSNTNFYHTAAIIAAMSEMSVRLFLCQMCEL